MRTIYNVTSAAIDHKWSNPCNGAARRGGAWCGSPDGLRPAQWPRRGQGPVSGALGRGRAVTWPLPLPPRRDATNISDLFTYRMNRSPSDRSANRSMKLCQFIRKTRQNAIIFRPSTYGKKRKKKRVVE